MPCNSITTQSVALKNAMPDIVIRAMDGPGWTLHENTGTQVIASSGSDRVVWTPGKGLEVTSRNAQPIITEITKAYSKQAVTWAAQRAGWQVQSTASDKLTVTRR